MEKIGKCSRGNKARKYIYQLPFIKPSIKKYFRKKYGYILAYVSEGS